MTKVCRLLRVSGRVQGVFFRASTAEVARRLGVAGHAVNLDDGSVEVLACGEADSVAELESWLWQGPPRAAVSAVEGRDQPFAEQDGFTTG